MIFNELVASDQEILLKIINEEDVFADLKNQAKTDKMLHEL